MKFGKYIIAILFFSLFNINSVLNAEDKNEEIKVEKNEDDGKTSLKLKLPQDLIKDKEQAIGSVKIDEDTTAKITISAKQNDEQEIKIETKKEEPKIEQPKPVENKKPITKSNNQKPVEYVIEKKVDLDELNNGSYVVIKDGDKNINIILKPDFTTCKNCKNGVKINNKTRVIKTTSSSKKQTKKVVNNQSNKNTKKVATKTTKKTTKNNIQSIKDIKDLQFASNQNKQKTDDFVEIESISKFGNEEHKSIRKIYENGEMSCVGDNCGVVINSKDNKKSNEKNNYGENVKIVEKETKVVEQPVYVVNRIINIDEDMNLTDEELNQIVIGKDGKATVVNSNNKNKKIVKKRNSSSSDRFKQQYDIIEANNMSYGEVAFVDDYND